MVDLVRRANVRKLRLHDCTCMRLTDPKKVPKWVLQLIEVAERYADGEVGQTERVFEELVGPSSLPTFSSSRRTDTVLTRQMYESRDFSAMPILADALQDAGCDNDDILSHCRDPKQVHVRGCWVVDLLLGK